MLNTKKILRFILALAAILAAIGAWHFVRQALTGHGKPKTTATASRAAAIPSPTGLGASELDVATSPDDAPIAELHGTDFTAIVSRNGNPLYKNLAIELNDGGSINDLVRSTGNNVKLENELFSAGDTFELRRLLPTTVREQLIVKGSEALSDGLGPVSTYAIYHVENTVVTELLNLVTERDFRGLKGDPALKIAATITEKTEDGQLSIVYSYAVNRTKPQTIIFKWNGKEFVDETGTYKQLDKKYRP
jgi:hypothetical protein